MGRLLVALAALALLAPASATAAFPGRNGPIAFGWHELEEDELGTRPPRELRALRTVPPRGGTATTLLRCERVGDVETGACAATAYAAPAYSPDGTRLAFDGGERLGLLDADGGGTVRLLPPRGADPGHPAFAPTGTRLAFDAVDAAGRRQLWISDIFGANARRLTGRGGAAPAWSSRGVIAFERGGQLFAVRPDGRGLRQLTGRGGRAPTWSPHGTQLAFVRGRAGALIVMRADGSRLRRVPGVGGVESVRWSPDGRRLAFEGFDAGVLTIDPDGGRERLLVTEAVGATVVQATRGIDWQPLR